MKVHGVPGCHALPQDWQETVPYALGPCNSAADLLLCLPILLQLTFPQPDDWNNPDHVQFGTKSVIGAPGTYNHLTDALLDVTTTRTMYMRRLRNLADKYYSQGRLHQVGD